MAPRVTVTFCKGVADVADLNPTELRCYRRLRAALPTDAALRKRQREIQTHYLLGSVKLTGRKWEWILTKLEQFHPLLYYVREVRSGQYAYEGPQPDISVLERQKLLLVNLPLQYREEKTRGNFDVFSRGRMFRWPLARQPGQFLEVSLRQMAFFQWVHDWCVLDFLRKVIPPHWVKTQGRTLQPRVVTPGLYHARV
jgi:hypothetical protein